MDTHVVVIILVLNSQVLNIDTYVVVIIFFHIAKLLLLPLQVRLKVFIVLFLFM